MVRGTPPLMTASHPALLGAAYLGEVWGGGENTRILFRPSNLQGTPSMPRGKQDGHTGTFGI